MRKLSLMILVALASGLSACNQEAAVGYVEIQAKPPINFTGSDAALFLNAVRVETLRNNAAVLRHSIGTSTLEFGRGEQRAALCQFAVRKNRVTTLTLTVVDRQLRCAVQT